MQDFFRKALIRSLVLMLVSGLVAYVCVKQSHLQDSLLTAQGGGTGWEYSSWASSTDARTTVRQRSEHSKFSFDFFLSGAPEHFVSSGITFKDKQGQVRLVDLSRYKTISFVARCSPANTLVVNIPTYVKSVTKKENFLSYRTLYAYFSCGETPSRIELDLDRLSTGTWWFDMFKVDLSLNEYKLDGVPKIEFGATFRSPTGVNSHAEIDEVMLNGRDYRYLYGLAAYLVAVVVGYAIWFFLAHTRALREHLRTKMQRDMPLVAYQQLSIQPHRDKEKSAILRVMATRYADPDLDLETLVLETGANRNKVNDILKAELGYTFSTYLNKLRLTEAARLLSDMESATIAEIAYSVGYKNIPYFNRLFKEEYNCTPKAFREVVKQAELAQ